MNKKDFSKSGSSDGKYLKVVSVRFQTTGTPYYFLAPLEMELYTDDWVVVQTVRGLQIGQVITVGAELSADLSPQDLKSIVRPASGLDMARRQFLKKRAEELVEAASKKLAELEERGAKILSAEFTLDGVKAILFYTGKLSEEQAYVDWQHHLSDQFDCQVELHTLGPRDVAKQLGGYGVCGEPCCCIRFLTDFKPISIHMAKDQSISLAPTDITGMCGRLRCCLDYEHQVYKDASQGFPRRKSHVSTPHGRGRVIDWDALKGDIIVEIPPDGPRRERRRHRFKLEEIEVVPRKRKR